MSRFTTHTQYVGSYVDAWLNNGLSSLAIAWHMSRCAAYDAVDCLAAYWPLSNHQFTITQAHNNINQPICQQANKRTTNKRCNEP
jgi:hypothetical protein